MVFKLGNLTCYIGELKINDKYFLNEYKIFLCSNCFLKHENMKLESLVIIYQRNMVNKFWIRVHSAHQVLGRNLIRS